MALVVNPPSDSFLAAVQNLTPPGRAFPRDADTLMAQVFAVPADALANVRAAALALANVEADPAYTLGLLADWEADYGLPDPCSPLNGTIEQRRASLLAKIASLGGQSIAYLTAVAALLGYAITIEEFTPAAPPVSSPSTGAPMNYAWRYAWLVNAPGVVVQRAAPGLSTASDPLWTISTTELACRLGALKPAHTVMLFNYG